MEFKTINFSSLLNSIRNVNGVESISIPIAIVFNSILSNVHVILRTDIIWSSVSGHSHWCGDTILLSHFSQTVFSHMTWIFWVFLTMCNIYAFGISSQEWMETRSTPETRNEILSLVHYKFFKSIAAWSEVDEWPWSFVVFLVCVFYCCRNKVGLRAARESLELPCFLFLFFKWRFVNPLFLSSQKITLLFRVSR